MREGWTYKKLGEVATYINGYAFKPSEWVETGMPIIRIQNLNNPTAPYNYYDGEIPVKYEVEYGDILISWSASLGAYEWKREKALLNQHIFKVVFDKLDINKYFLKYAVEGKINDMLKDVHGATMKHIVKKDFDNTIIPYPSIDEQQQIVSELDLLSSVIEKQKAQIEELDKLAQSIFYDMFGDPVENEKGWEVKTLGSLCHNIVRGPFGSALKKEYFVEKDDTTYKIYEQKHAIQKSSIIGNYYISKEKYEELKRFEVFPHDIIMSCSGTIGEFYIIPEKAEKGVMNQALLKFSLNHTLIREDYFLFVMQFVKKNFTIHGTGLQNIGSVKIIKSLPISLPPLTLQQEFANKIEAIESMKAKVRQSLKESEMLFNSRMDFYFS